MDKLKSFTIGGILAVLFQLLSVFYPDALKVAFKFIMSFAFLCFLIIPVSVIFSFILRCIVSILINFTSS